MKALRKDKLESEQSIRNIKAERDILIKITQDKPHFINHMKFNFESLERIFFVTPFMKSGELKTHIKMIHAAYSTGMSSNATRHIIAQVCVAIQFLHDNNILFGDMKPENVLMDEDGYVAITDFGVSTIFKEDEVKEKEGLDGTLEYMAPEICTKPHIHGFPVDIWAIGVTAFEMLTGISPFSGTSEVQ